MAEKVFGNDLNIKEIIRKKRDGFNLKEEEIKFFVDWVVKPSVEGDKDSYIQIGAMLMAVWMKGMNGEETAHLTHYMATSGEVLTWPAEWRPLMADKHSTGGVGDKISLVLAPALAACGLKVPMISGRALGHTGGTLDKLEAIPGFNISQSSGDIKRILDEVGCCIVGQTKDIAPADKVLYPARDVTYTVDSLPLIVGSILSKKIAENVSALILDVKFGKAAFMKEKDQARELAEAMVGVGNRLNIKTSAVLSSMDCPVGFAVGNALEVLESLECLHGKGPEDLEEMVVEEGAHLIQSLGRVSGLEEGKVKLREVIHNGMALEKFRLMAIAQGATVEDATRLCTLGEEFKVMKKANNVSEVFAQKSGYVNTIEPMNIAIAASQLGAARTAHGGKINHAVGIVLGCKLGQKVQKDELVATIYHDSATLDQSVRELVQTAIVVDERQPAPFHRIHDVIH